VEEAPVTQEALNALSTCTLEQVIPPIEIVIPLTNPVPTIVIVVPPALGPLGGETLSTLKSFTDASCLPPISSPLVHTERAIASPTLRAALSSFWIDRE